MSFVLSALSSPSLNSCELSRFVPSAARNPQLSSTFRECFCHAHFQPATGSPAWAGKLSICSLLGFLQFHRYLLQCTLSCTLGIRLIIPIVPCNGNHSDTGFRQLLWLASLLFFFAAIYSQLLFDMGRGSRTAHSIHEEMHLVMYQS